MLMNATPRHKLVSSNKSAKSTSIWYASKKSLTTCTTSLYKCTYMCTMCTIRTMCTMCTMCTMYIVHCPFRVHVVEESAIQHLRKKIYANMSALVPAFQKFDPNETGQSATSMCSQSSQNKH